ncbi:MAG: alpha/beta fold hydrolase [Caldilineaceae bacterium]|nr:alpha/beta fold hydrolase [Caldilinea sp.]MCB9119723.1 alpha/beta fold hydrolase [Caldilineaceae bacterium]
MNEKRAADSGSIPVVLVPGWLDNANKMGSLATFLQKEGFATLILSPQPSDGSVPVETLAGQLAEEIERRFAPGQMIDYVGFSMGGLIGRSYLHWLGGSERIRRFVTISTPHRGAIGGRLAWQPALRQMAPDSPFITSLNENLGDLESRPFLSIWTPLDLTVVPADSSVLPVGEARRIINPAHALMVYDRRVQRAVAEFLAEP